MSQTATVIRPASSDALPRITYEEFLQRYEGIRAEWVDGEVQMMSPVSNAHQRVGNFLFRIISDFVEVHDLGAIFQLEFQMKLVQGRPGREPDLFFVPKAKFSQLTPGYFDGPGDLVIEIISPESIKRNWEDKFLEYQSGGVPEFWLIDPVAQQVNFFLLDENGRFQNAQQGADGIYHSTWLPDFWLRVDWLWQSPPPPMNAVRRELGLS